MKAVEVAVGGAIVVAVTAAEVVILVSDIGPAAAVAVARTVISIGITPAMHIVRRRRRRRAPILKRNQAQPHEVAQPRKHGQSGLDGAENAWLRDEHDLLVGDEPWMQTPCRDEEFSVVIRRNVTRSDNVHLGTSGPEDCLRRGHVPSMQGDAPHPHKHPKRE